MIKIQMTSSLENLFKKDCSSAPLRPPRSRSISLIRFIVVGADGQRRSYIVGACLSLGQS